MTDVSPTRTKLLTALLPGNPIVLGTAKSGFMYEIKNTEVIYEHIYQELSRPTENRQTTPRLKSTALNPKHLQK